MAMRQIILNADNALGKHIRLELAAFIHEKLLSDGNGVYTPDDWSKIRTLGYQEAGIDCSALDEDGKYLTRIFKTQYRKFVAAQRLCNVFNFSKVSSVLELGCGEMVQALVITKLFPHINYRATDFDPYIISKCSKLSILNHIEKSVLDLFQLETNDLKDYQMVISWELVYALKERALCNLFKALGKASVSMIICTTQLTGPCRTIIRWWKGIPKKGKNTPINMRMHGWHHSLGLYKAIAKGSGMRLIKIWYPPPKCRNGDNFTFVLFAPDK